MKVNCTKTEYMCVNEREAGRTVRLQWSQRCRSSGTWDQLSKEVWKRGEEESTGRTEWMEKSVRSDV